MDVTVNGSRSRRSIQDLLDDSILRFISAEMYNVKPHCGSLIDSVMSVGN